MANNTTKKNKPSLFKVLLIFHLLRFLRSIWPLSYCVQRNGKWEPPQNNDFMYFFALFSVTHILNQPHIHKQYHLAILCSQNCRYTVYTKIHFKNTYLIAISLTFTFHWWDFIRADTWFHRRLLSSLAGQPCVQEREKKVLGNN